MLLYRARFAAVAFIGVPGVCGFFPGFQRAEANMATSVPLPGCGSGSGLLYPQASSAPLA